MLACARMHASEARASVCWTCRRHFVRAAKAALRCPTQAKQSRLVPGVCQVGQLGLECVLRIFHGTKPTLRQTPPTAPGQPVFEGQASSKRRRNMTLAALNADKHQMHCKPIRCIEDDVHRRRANVTRQLARGTADAGEQHGRDACGFWSQKLTGVRWLRSVGWKQTPASHTHTLTAQRSTDNRVGSVAVRVPARGSAACGGHAVPIGDVRTRSCFSCSTAKGGVGTHPRQPHRASHRAQNWYRQDQRVRAPKRCAHRSTRARSCKETSAARSLVHSARPHRAPRHEHPQAQQATMRRATRLSWISASVAAIVRAWASLAVSALLAIVLSYGCSTQ